MPYSGSRDVVLVDNDGNSLIDSGRLTVDAELQGPRSSDGKAIFLPSIFRGDIDINFPGAGDDSGYGTGNAFEVSHATIGETSVTFSFEDWIYIAGGAIQFAGAKLGDWVSFEASAPASLVTAANPAGTGNCNLVDTGAGFNVIVPAAGDGAWDIADDDKVPVPASNSDGYWEWDTPDIGKGTVSASATPGAAQYHLYDIALPLVRWATKVRLLGSGVLEFWLNAVKPKRLLPHWEMKTTFHNTDGTHTLEACWYFLSGRKRTV